MKRKEECPCLEGYRAEKVSVSLAKANLMSLLALGFFGILFVFPYYWIWNEIRLTATIFWLLYLILGIIVHELIHGLVFAILLRDFRFRHIRFGVIWKSFAFYCHCEVPLKKTYYLIAGMMPLIILGIFPGVLGILLHQFDLVFFGVLLSTCAIGDIMVAWKMRRLPDNALLWDLPDEPGFMQYVPEQASK